MSDVGFDATLPTGRDLSQEHDRIEFRVRETAQERLDRYLLQRLGWKSRNKVQRLIKLGRVTVNDERPKIARRVFRGDVIRIRLDPGGSEENDAIELGSSLWEDPYLIAVDKPPHRLVHPVGRTVSGTVVNELHLRYHEVNQRGSRPVVAKLCHRLDRDTSGLLLVAKCDLARRRLSDDFENGRVRKTYLALVEGRPSEPRFQVDVPIRANLDRERESGHRLACADPTGKAAETQFEVLVSSSPISLVRCFPQTGRQNQIRIHLAHAGHPILGDVGYGATIDERPEGERRAMLHSESLRFLHPVWQTSTQITAPVAGDFLPFLERLAPGAGEQD